MPLYEYRCKKCGEVFDKIRRVGDADSEVTCPRCESEETERQFSTFATGGCGAGSGGGRSRFT